MKKRTAILFAISALALFVATKGVNIPILPPV